jgi:hypothetical protein
MTAYVLENNNYVINGPREWNYRSFESTLEEDLEIEYKLPTSKNDEEIITIDENTHIYPARYDYPTYNQKIEYIHGPFWDFSTGIAIGTFEVLRKPIEDIRVNLKQKVAANRYTKEIAGTKITMHDTEVTIDTSRDARNIFIQQLMLMEDTATVQWKFPEGWLTLTKSELGLVVLTGAAYIQAQFEWEVAKGIEIDTTETAEELDLIDVGDPVQQVTKPGMLGI